MSKKRSRKRMIRRRMLLERMEKRLPLAVDVAHNFLMPGDVNDDNSIKASDALAVINMLAEQSSRGDDHSVSTESVDASISGMFLDVNDDGRASALDAIRVINQLSAGNDSAERGTVLESDDGARAIIELELKGNGAAEFEVRLTGAPADQSFDVTVGGETIGQIQTDERGRGELELKYGNGGAALPDVLANADASTTVEIGDILSGTLRSIGDLDQSDGGSDGPSDGNSDAASDGNSDADSGSISLSDGGVDGSSDGSSDSGVRSSIGDADSSNRSDRSNQSLSGGDLDDLTADNSDDLSGDDSDDLAGDNSDGGSDGSSDGNSDGNSDG